MKKYSVRIFAGLAAALLLFAGCGSKSSSYDGGYYNNNYMVEETAAAASAGYAPVTSAAHAPMALSDSAMGMKEMAYEDADYSEGGSTGSSFSGVSEAELEGSNTNELQNSRKLIRNVDLSLQTTSYDQVTETIRRRVSELGGYIEQSNAFNGGYYGRTGRSMHLTARIPNDRLDEFLDTSLENAKVTNRTERTEDITLRYTDIEARVAALEVERDRLMELLAKAENIESIIALESRLSDIRYELESIHSSLRVYDNQVAYSTVTIAIDEVEVVTPSKKATFGERIASGFQQSVLNVIEAAGDLIVGFLSNLPMILFLLVVLLVIFLVLKKIFLGIPRWFKRRREKKLAKKAAKEAADAGAKTPVSPVNVPQPGKAEESTAGSAQTPDNTANTDQ